jgi:hypothetical protein
MKRFPSALWRYLAGVAIAGAVALGGSWLMVADSRPVSVPLMALLALLLLLAESFPEHVIRGAKLSLGTIPIFAAVLYLPLGAAVTALVVGITAAQLVRRSPWFEMLFNAASLAIATYLGGLVYLALGGGRGSTVNLMAAIASAGVIYMVTVSIIAGVVAIQHNLRYASFWRQMASAEAWQHGMMYAGGAVLALLCIWTGAWGGLFAVAALVALAVGRGLQWPELGLRRASN